MAQPVAEWHLVRLDDHPVAVRGPLPDTTLGDGILERATEAVRDVTPEHAAGLIVPTNGGRRHG